LRNLVPGSPDIVERGNVTRGLAEADVIVRREYRTPVQIHTALEPHGAVAEWDGDRLTIWESTQAVFRVREGRARPRHEPVVRARIKEHMGGASGRRLRGCTHVRGSFARTSDGSSGTLRQRS
jgi:xanthine dehydrogenase YagR molybdenum-binding subunit